MSSAATRPAGRAGTIVVGLGNPILGDDGIGWKVVDELELRLAGEGRLRDAMGPLELDRLSVGGLTLMERLVGFGRAIVIDADATMPAGTVRVAPLADIEQRRAQNLDSPHDVTLTRAVELAEQTGAPVPGDILVVAVGIPASAWFSEELSAEVAAAVGRAADAVVDVLAGTSVS